MNCGGGQEKEKEKITKTLKTNNKPVVGESVPRLTAEESRELLKDRAEEESEGS